MKSSLLFLLNSFLVLLNCANSAIPSPIPVTAAWPGLVYGPGRPDAHVIIDAFLEPLCPDSLKAWPILKQVSNSYNGSDVSLRINLQPLPYHRNGFLSTQGFWLVAERHGRDAAFIYLEHVLMNYTAFSTGNTENKTLTEITSDFAEFASSVTNVGKNEFIDNIGDYSWPTIQMWKHNVRRGVAGTPWYHVNGVDLSVNPSTEILYDDWRDLIDLLLLEIKPIFPPKSSKQNVEVEPRIQDISEANEASLLSTNKQLPNTVKQLPKPVKHINKPNNLKENNL